VSRSQSSSEFAEVLRHDSHNLIHLYKQEDMKPNIERKRPIFSVFDRNNGKGTVHPQNGDIEAGGSRGVKFSKNSQDNENAALKMVRT
jgi:hypothetical protein